MLPNVPLSKGTVEVGDEKVEVRALSRAEAMRLPHFQDDADAAETFVLARGAGITEEEAAAWRDATAVDAVGAVVDKILELSGFGDEVSKSDGPEPAAG